MAGLEPTQTNLLLQTIGKCIDKKLDSTQYVQQLKQKSKSKTSDVESKTKKLSESISKNRQKPKEQVVKEKAKKESSNKDIIESKRKAEEKKKTEKVRKGDVTPKKGETPDKTKISKEKVKKDDVVALQKPEAVIKDSNKQVEELEEQRIEKNETEEPPAINNLNASNSGDLDNIVPTEIANTASDDIETIAETKPTLIRPKSARPKSGDLNKQNKEECNTYSNLFFNHFKMFIFSDTRTLTIKYTSAS